MPRFKPYSYEQTKMIPLSFDRQILPGTFEYTISKTVNTLDLTLFHRRFKNDDNGAPAFDPAILLKIVLYAYSKGVVSSRKIAQLCDENVVFMALSADSHPHFTTIADFVSSMQEEILPLFRQVVLVCLELDLIEGSMFAIDGCKISLNASKEWSGTKEDLGKKREKLIKALDYMVKRHIEKDKRGEISEDEDRNFDDRLKAAQAKIDKLEKWLSENEDKPGKRRRVRQSNITDNESAKMKTSHGVIQGYTGVAAVDAKHQIVVHTEAFGEGQEGDTLAPVMQGLKTNLKEAGLGPDVLEGAVITADSNFHSIENLKVLHNERADGYIPDNNFRKRDPRFSTAFRHKGNDIPREKFFETSDFHYDKRSGCYICPAGKKLHTNKNLMQILGLNYYAYKASRRDCGVCGLKARCMRNERSKSKSININKDPYQYLVKEMASKIDTPDGREIYSKRMAIIEPVFGNIRGAKRMDRFTLRTKRKVNIQWLLYCLVHNIEKICNYAPQWAV